MFAPLKHIFDDPYRTLFNAQPWLCKIWVRDVINLGLKLSKPKSPGFSPSSQAQSLAHQLRTRGITEPIAVLSAAQVAEMRTYFEHHMCADPWRPHLGSFLYKDIPSPETNMGIYGHDISAKAPHALEFLNAPILLETAELYLGCKPLIDNVFAWWSYSNRTEAKGTQWYHRDVDSMKFLKAFIFLTDVESDSGPHDYIQGSHRSNVLATTKRVSDQEVADAFIDDDHVSVTGPAGTVFLADTYGLHRGRLPEKNQRLLFAGAYVNVRTPHGPKAPVAALPQSSYDPDINKVYFS